MLVTEHAVRTTRTISRRTSPSLRLPSPAAAIAWALRAGNLRAWLCFGFVAYVLGVALLNLVRFGLYR